MSKIRVAIVGVGNCASSLVQGIEYYRNAKPEEQVPGLMNVMIGGYHVKDIEFVAAFDVNQTKVGKDLSEAIFCEPNNTIKISDVPKIGVTVKKGKLLDGIGKYLKELVKISDVPEVDVVAELKSTKAEVIVSYLPVGSEEATKFYVEAALQAGCGFINCIPVFIGREKVWQDKFKAKGLPIIGDDIKSQVGATIVHRVLTNIFKDRGVRLLETSQLNVGGNTDFLNMLERERLESKKISKTFAVSSQLGHPMKEENIHIGPSDYIPWLKDRKWCHIFMRGQAFGDVPINLELKLEVWDSPNSAGVVIDAIRCIKLALDNGVSGNLFGPSSYFMKSPPEQYTDSEAYKKTQEFIKEHSLVKVK
jgi:myo-inositol-1-phosphate synthase